MISPSDLYWVKKQPFLYQSYGSLYNDPEKCIIYAVDCAVQPTFFDY